MSLLARPKQILRGAIFALVLVTGPAFVAGQTSTSKRQAPPILEYISKGWDELTRSMDSCTTLVDSKIAGKTVLYVPVDFGVPENVRGLERKCGIEVRVLPGVIHKAGELADAQFNPQGLLYLPNRYVVPGGRFNEMYGWDSYFIIRGLLSDKRVDLARGMVENFFFEIEHYGSILNANRTYYLSRAQPPFLTSMILAVYKAETKDSKDNRAWLERAYEYAVRDHALWLRSEHLAGNSGLSRYFDFGEGPAPESLKDEADHYRQVAEYFVEHPEKSDGRLDERQPGTEKDLGPGTRYSLRLCNLPQTMERMNCSEILELSLSEDFYKGDRAMRESGFDISFRFGAFGAYTHHYAPDCLNSLLYKSEMDLAEMSEILGRTAEADSWRGKAGARKAAINKYLWDEEKGEFFDYDFMKQKRSSYEYITTFYPLWTGLATPEQARAVAANLKIFEKPGGAAPSPYKTGAQWDLPYAWAPTEMILVEGLRRYGFAEAADRVAYEFASTIAENYARQGYIVEKYNAVTRSTDTPVTSGYNTNVVGFGWTNTAYLEFLKELPESKRAQLTRIH
jgi:alpha,alpha-trehalase